MWAKFGLKDWDFVFLNANTKLQLSQSLSSLTSFWTEMPFDGFVLGNATLNLASAWLLR
jgi:hypothetical protein